MNTYEVIAYHDCLTAHECWVTEDGVKAEKRYIDLMVNGDLDKSETPEALVGRKFTAEYDYPYIAIAMGVKEVK